MGEVCLGSDKVTLKESEGVEKGGVQVHIFSGQLGLEHLVSSTDLPFWVLCILQIKMEVNKLYRQVELDVDGVFKYMLLLKKKKYAAVTISRLPSGELITQQELKGLDIVRRDWSQLSAEAGK